MSNIFPEAHVKKSERTGWKAKTTFPLAPGVMPDASGSNIAAKREGQEVLQISTYKGDRGQLVTHATCARMKEEAGYSTMTFEIFGDYSRRIISRTARCTEKTVREQHAHGVTMVGAVIEEAREYYRRKAAGHGVRECYTFGNFADYLAAYTERTGPADVLPRDCISAAHI